MLSLSNHTKEVTSIDGCVDKDGVSYLIGSGSDDGVVTLFKWNPNSKQVENTFCRNIMEKSVIGLHLQKSTMYITFYNSSSIFVLNF